MRTLTLLLTLYIASLSLSGCASPADIKTWSFSVAAPKHYGVWVEHLELEKSGAQHWRMPIGAVDCCWKGVNGPSGKGGPITNFPDYVAIQWFSYSEQRYYQRLIPVPKNTKDKMEKLASYSIAGEKREGPRDMIVLGLAPGGTIVLWIMNQIGNEIEVARFQATEIEGDPSEYEAGTQRYLDEHGPYLEKHGVPTEGW